jgi:N-acetylglucosamine-6-sulfatase
MRAVEGVTPISLDTVTPDETIRDRLEMLLSIDDGLGKILSALERAGTLDDTVVVFTSDHGYFYGEHGLNAERRFAYEESIRIPLVARYPRLIKPGTTPGQLTLTIDLAPTLLELGRAAVPRELQGRSLVPLLGGGRPKDWRTSVLIEHHSDPESYLGRSALRRALNMGYQAVRTERHKYIQYTELSGMDELYDLESDPYEMNNLFANPQRASTLQAMRDELARLLRETGGQARP